jgi:hypothetical protein
MTVGSFRHAIDTVLADCCRIVLAMPEVREAARLRVEAVQPAGVRRDPEKAIRVFEEWANVEVGYCVCVVRIGFEQSGSNCARYSAYWESLLLVVAPTLPRIRPGTIARVVVTTAPCRRIEIHVVS